MNTVDHDAAARAVFLARKNDEAEAAGWERELERRREEGYQFSAPVVSATESAPVNSAYVAEMQAALDSGWYGAPAVAEEISEQDRAFAFSAHGEYVALCKERTGDFLPDDVRDKRALQAADLLEQSHAIAKKMAEGGFNAYRETGFDLVRYYVHSRAVEKLPSFRRTCFIPAVGQAIRAPMVAALEYWLSRNPFARFWTFSTGPRTRLCDVRTKAQWLHARLNDLNAQPFMHDAGVRMVFRSTELGTPETDSASSGGEIERDTAGELLFHVHAHVVVELAKGYIAPEKWSAVVKKVGAFWSAWWGEGGAIRNAREACKYVTKPGEMLKLSGAELVALQEQLTRLKLVQPLGSLAKEIAERETAGKRLIKRQTPEGRVYFAVKNWNRHARRTDVEKTQDAAQKLTPKTARGAVKIVSRGTPRFNAAGVAEPVVTVMFMRGSWHEGTVRSHALVAPVIRATVHEYDAGCALRKASSGISVHTRTPTVLERPEKPRGKPKRARLGAAAAGF